MENTICKNGTPSNYHFKYTDRIDALHPLEIPFFLNEGITKIQSAIFGYDLIRISEATGEEAKDFNGTKNYIRVCIDENEVTVTDYIKGTLDMTQFLAATPGWHKIAIYSTLYISISWKFDIKSFC